MIKEGVKKRLKYIILEYVEKGDYLVIFFFTKMFRRKVRKIHFSKNFNRNKLNKRK